MELRARILRTIEVALQACLDGQRVRESAIDGLVGHAPRTTWRRHYAAVAIAELRELSRDR